MKTKISAAYMENGLKRNWTVEDFCADLGIEEAELKRLLKKHFSEKVERYYLGRLSKNQKLFKKTKQTVTNQIVVDGSEVIEHSESCEECEEEDTLEKLKNREKQLKQSIFEFEIENKKLRELRKEQESKVEKVYKTFESLLSKIKEERVKLDEIEIELNNVNLSISELSSKKAFAKNELEEVKKKIRDCEIITIYYMTNGQIKTIGYEENLPELQIDKTLNEMMEVELLEDLTLKELRIMARIIATAVYVKNTTNREVKFKFEESSNISAAIELLDEISSE